MSKVSVTLQFNSVEEALEFLQPAPPVRIVQSGPLIGPLLGALERPEVPVTPVPTTETPGKKPRKPRSDAGQPRGPYKDKKPADEAPAETPQPATVPAESPAASVAELAPISEPVAQDHVVVRTPTP